MQTTRDNPELRERVRVVTSSSYGLRAIGRLGFDVGDGTLRLLGQAGLGYASHESQLKHEQYTINSEGFPVEGSALFLRETEDSFAWGGLETSVAAGLAYRLVGTSWRLVTKTQWQKTFLPTVRSFVEGAGAQSTLGLTLGVSGTF